MRLFYLAVIGGTAALWFVSATRALRRTQARYESEGSARTPAKAAVRRSVLRSYVAARVAAVVSGVTAVVLFPFPMNESDYWLAGYAVGAGLLLISTFFAIGSLLILRLRYGREAIRERDTGPRLEADYVSIRPPAGPAIQNPKVAELLRRYRLSAVATLVVSLTLLVIALAYIQFVNDNPPPLIDTLLVLIVGGGPVAAILGGVMIRRYQRVRRCVTDNPWVVRRCRFAAVSYGNSTMALLLLLNDDGTDDVLLIVRTVMWRAKVLSHCDKKAAWIAGDPHRDVAVTAPGVDKLQFAMPPRIERRRRAYMKRLKRALGEE